MDKSLFGGSSGIKTQESIINSLSVSFLGCCVLQKYKYINYTNKWIYLEEHQRIAVNHCGKKIPYKSV